MPSRKVQKAIDVLATGATVAEAAKEVGLSRTQLSRVINNDHVAKGQLERKLRTTQHELTARITNRFEDVDAMMEACRRELAHPLYDGEFTLAAHLSEVDVVVETLDEDGRVNRETRNLAELCQQCEQALGIRIVKHHTRATDPRTLMLKSAETFIKLADLWAKLKGLYVQPKQNPEDLKDRDTALRRIIADLQANYDKTPDEAARIAHQAVLLKEKLASPLVQ